jgi:hypothetical protein
MMKYACALVVVSIVACSPAMDSRSSDDGISSIPDGQSVVVNCQNSSGTGWVYAFEMGGTLVAGTLMVGGAIDFSYEATASWEENKVYITGEIPLAPFRIDKGKRTALASGSFEIELDRRTLFAKYSYESDRVDDYESCKLERVGQQL